MPKPPPGYWARVKHGWKPVRPPLSKWNGNDPDYHIFQPKNHQPSSSYPKKKNTEDVKPIAVSSRLVNPHPLIIKTRHILEGVTPNPYGILRAWRQEYVDIRVGPDSLGRALRIMDALIKHIEVKGYQISIKLSDRYTSMSALVEEEKFDFFLKEKTLSCTKALTEREKRFMKKYPAPEYTPYRCLPTGELSLIIDTYTGRGYQKKWLDHPSKPLENQLGDFVAGLLALLPERQKEREERRRRELIYQREIELRRLRELEEERLRRLEALAEQWVKSARLRSFIDEVERRAYQKGITGEMQLWMRRWLTWARRHADRLDPLNGGLPFEPNPESDE